MKIKFSKISPLGFIAFGILINTAVPICTINKETIISFLFWKWSLNITLIKCLLKER